MNNFFFTFFLICFTVCQAATFKNRIDIEEVFYENKSSVFLNKNDSIQVKIKFDKIIKLNKKEEYAKALKQALELLKESKRLRSYYWIYKATFLIADIYDKTNNFNLSLKYFKESSALLNSNDFEKRGVRLTNYDLADIIFKIGSTYHKLSRSIDIGVKLNPIDSIKNLNDKKQFIDSAKLYYEKLEIISDFNPEIESLKAKTYGNLSDIYRSNLDYAKAKEYAYKAIKIHKKNNNSLTEAKSLNNLGNIFLLQKNYEESKRIYSEALDLIKNNNNFNAIQAKARLNYNLAWSMRNLEDYKAYDYQEQYIIFQDQIREKEFKRIMARINAENNVEDVREEEKNKRIPFWVAGIIGLIVIISLGYWLKLNQLKQKNLALEFEQTKLIQNKNLDKLKSESQIRILNATIDGKESERKQIAETLHDNVSALLSSANLHLQATRKQFNGSTPIEIHKTQEIIMEASHKIRDLSHTLVSSVLLKFGLDFAINDMAEKYSNSELNIETDMNDIGRYHQGFEIKVHNIIQEFVNNIIKHSKAKNALIALREEDKKLFLEISDDGLGFDKTKITMKDGLGINQIDARIQVMKGRFFIESSFNNGTKISVELPVVEKEEVSYA